MVRKVVGGEYLGYLTLKVGGGKHVTAAFRCGARLLKREVPRVKPERVWVLKLLKLLEEYGFVSKRRGVYGCGKKTLYYLNYRRWARWLYCARRECPCGDAACPYSFILNYVGAAQRAE